MSLSAGTRLESYEIVALLGAGGMGEVYRARDTTLNREVVLKIMPDAFCRGSGTAGTLHTRGADAGGAQSSAHRADSLGSKSRGVSARS